MFREALPCNPAGYCERRVNTAGKKGFIYWGDEKDHLIDTQWIICYPGTGMPLLEHISQIGPQLPGSLFPGWKFP
jgi:hypothetical protein